MFCKLITTISLIFIRFDIEGLNWTSMAVLIEISNVRSYSSPRRKLITVRPRLLPSSNTNNSSKFCFRFYHCYESINFPGTDNFTFIYLKKVKNHRLIVMPSLCTSHSPNQSQEL